MREIKFRAWAKCAPKGEHSMTYWKLGTGLDNSNFFKHAISKEYGDGGVMQFTGLKDKNGKEIYEGDLLKFFDKIIAEVVFVPLGGWSYKWIDPTYIRVRQRNPEPFFHNTHLWEVAGNVFENPELVAQGN